MDVKEKVIQAASVLFVKHGYANVTIKDILELAKASRGGFYHYYESKEEVFKEVMDSYYLNDDSLTLRETDVYLEDNNMFK